MRRLIKFLHTMGAIGFMGSLAAILVLARLAPPPTSVSGYALVRGAMAEIASWIIMPSLVLTLVPGLAAIGVTKAFHNAGWAWAKAATGILIFAGGLHTLAPIQEEAQLSADAVAGRLDPGQLSGISGGEIVTLWVMFMVSTANVALGVWRPRLGRSTAREARETKTTPASEADA